MNENRAHEIIAAYGGDPVRWPAAERDAALRLVARDPMLTRARDDAAALDTLLIGWAHGHDEDAVGDASGDTAADAALAHLVAPPAQPRRWLPTAIVGGAVAAAVAGFVALTPAGIGSTPTRIASIDRAQVAQASADAALLAQVFTPTPEEESLI